MKTLGGAFLIGISIGILRPADMNSFMAFLATGSLIAGVWLISERG